MTSDAGHRTKMVVFDLGGTTIHDDGTIDRVFSEVATECKLDAHLDTLGDQQGRTKKEVFLSLAGHKHHDWPEAAASLADEANQAYEDRLMAHFTEAPLTVVAGTTDAMQYLRDHGIKVAITSGFWRAVMDVILERTGLRALLDASVSTDEVARPKPAPYMIFRAMEACDVVSVRHVVSVGDTPLDCIAGHNAGCGTVIGVLSGTHTRAALEAVPHNFIADSSARVRELFETGRIH